MRRTPVTFLRVMRIKSNNLNSIVAALVAIFAFCTVAAANPKVENLLEELKEAPESDAPRLERELSLLWDRSGSASMDLLLERGRDAMNEENYREAIEHFTALTDHAPDFAEGWHARATAYYRLDLYGPALDDLQRALALNPQNFDAIFGLGVMFQEFGDLTRAVEAFERVLALHPNHENAKSAMDHLQASGIGTTL